MKSKTITSCKLLLIPLLWLMTLLPRAQATETVINFDGLADGTQINTYYPGVTFTNPIGGNIYARNIGSFAPSPSNMVSVFGAPTFPQFDAAQGAVDAHFSTPMRVVKFDVRPEAPLEFSDPLTKLPFLQAFDSGNNLLGAVYYSLPLPTNAGQVGPAQTLVFASSSINIAYCRVSSQNPVSATATYVLPDNLVYDDGIYNLNLFVNGSGGIATVPLHGPYTYGTMVTLTANPVAGWSFNGWTGDVTSTNNPLTITMDGNKNVTANFIVPSQTGPNFIVTTTDDHDDGVAGIVDCTLREAINAANANPDASTITFATNVTGVIKLTLGQLPITTSVTIRGPGAKVLSVSGNNSSRVFAVGGNPVLISDLSIINGFAAGTAGSAGTPTGGTGGSGGSGIGGAIYNIGNLTLSNCWVTGCTAQAGAGGLGGIDDDTHPAGTGGVGGVAAGGGILNLSSLTLINCTVSGNAAIGGDGGIGSHAFDNFGTDEGGPGGAAGSGFGGGIYNLAILNVTNCTISGNTATGGAGGNAGDPYGDGNGAAGGAAGGAGGGGIYSTNIIHIFSSTVSLNSTGAGAVGIGSAGRSFSGPNGPPGAAQGGGLDGTGSTNTLQNSLVAGNSATNDPDCHGSFTSQGYNLIGIIGSATGFTGTGDQTGTGGSPLNPLLGPLVDLGGPTPTMELLPGSPAMDKGNRGVLTMDQRGSPRPYDLPSIANASGGDGSDIGAFELSQPLLTMTQTPSNVMFSWPVNYAGYTLRCTPQLTPPVTWITVGVSPVIVGSNYTVTTSLAAGNQFYRLVWAGVAAVPGIFNTGVGTNGAILASGTVDPHWTLFQSPDASFPGPNAIVVNDSGFPIPPWLANGPASKWIAPQASEAVGNLSGDYKYRITFDLTGLEPSTAVVTGHWTSDNIGTQVLLNGVATGLTNNGDFTMLGNPFAISAGFVSGTNTLDFVVNNAGPGTNPTGMRAELSGTANFKILP